VKHARLIVSSVAAFYLIGVVTLSYAPDAESSAPPAGVEDSGLPGDALAVSPPPFSEGIFPCSQCHLETDVVDKTRREIAIHNDGIFEHDAANRWCLDCHDAQKRDFLHLADGRLIPFEESYKLCGQCHGPQLRDWKAGDHGKRTGSWSGKKQYMLCASCHNPHSPHFKPIPPLPPPIRQEDLR
jgi:Doubled CXXCH motif (Paired_CXXCH_1)